MPDNRVQIDIVAENADLRAKLAQAESQLEGFKKGNEGAATSADAALQQATKSARSLSQIMRFIVLPAAIWDGAKRLLTFFSEAEERAKAFRNQVSAIAQQFETISRQGSLELRLGALELDQAKIQEQARAAADAVNQALQAALADPNRVADQNIFGGMFGTKSNDDLVREATAALDRIESARQQLQAVAAENAKRRAFAEETELFRIRASVAVGEEKRKLEMIVALRERAAALERSRGTKEERDRAKAIADERAKAEATKIDRDRQNERDARQSAERSQQGELANTDREREEIEHQERIAAIRREFRDRDDAESIAAMERRLENERKIYDKHLALMKQAHDRQLREMLEADRKAQTEGFTIKDLNTANIGSGAALQVIGQQLPALVTLSGGGR